MALVSIVIPTYNRSELLEYAIRSALNQTYKNIEVLVVDDGSTDNTADVVAAFNEKVKYLYKLNGGVSSARNYGIKYSNGDFVAFLDSDDEWLPDKIEKQLKIICGLPNYDMVLTDCYFVDMERKPIGRSYRRNSLPKDGFILDDVFMSPSLIPSSVLIKKNILDKVGYFDESLRTAEDLDLHLRIAANSNIVLLPEPLFYCMRGNEGLSALSVTYDDHVHVLERNANLHYGNLSPSIIKKALFKTYVSAANGKLWLKDLQAGIKYTRKAVKYVSNTTDTLKVVQIIIKGIIYFMK